MTEGKSGMTKGSSKNKEKALATTRAYKSSQNIIGYTCAKIPKNSTTAIFYYTLNIDAN
jgi:hypothetical protein